MKVKLIKEIDASEFKEIERIVEKSNQMDTQRNEWI